MPLVIIAEFYKIERQVGDHWQIVGTIIKNPQTAIDEVAKFRENSDMPCRIIKVTEEQIL